MTLPSREERAEAHAHMHDQQRYDIPLSPTARFFSACGRLLFEEHV